MKDDGVHRQQVLSLSPESWMNIMSPCDYDLFAKMIEPL
jgi:hypothetical protein